MNTLILWFRNFGKEFPEFEREATRLPVLAEEHLIFLYGSFSTFIFASPWGKKC